MKKLYVIFILFIFPFIGYSQNKPLEEVNIDDFVSETQYGSNSQDDIEIIWWVPTEYWEVVFAHDSNTTQAEKEGIVNMLKEYVVVIIIKGSVGVFGGVTYDDAEYIKSIVSVDFKGETLAMVEESKINPDMVNFISMIKPMMSNMIGPMGQNMQIFLFENPINKSILPINPYSKTDLVFKLGSFHKEASLPLGCLLEEKICPDDNLELNGKWNYCPIHGTKLSNKKSK